MRYILWICVLVHFSLLGQQKVNTVKGGDEAELLYYDVLPDKGYPFKQVQSDSKLPFQEQGIMDAGKVKVFWFRLKIKSANPEAYLYAFPSTDAEVFAKDAHEQWCATRNGLLVASGRRDLQIPLSLKTDTINTIFVKIRLHGIEAKIKKLAPTFKLYKASWVNERENYLYTAWLVTLILILLFIINITIDYFILREQTHMYYILLLLGGLIYGTSFHKLFNLLTDWRMLKIHPRNAGSFLYYDLNNFFNQLGLLLIVIGYVQLTRKFLKTAALLPRWDRVLKIITMIYLSVNLLEMLVMYFTDFYLMVYISQYMNIILIVIVLFIFTIGFKSLKGGSRNARLFLIANTIPLIIIIISAVYLNVVFYDAYKMLLLPYLGILSFSLTFSIALVIRTRFVRSELEEKQMEALVLEGEKERIRLEHDLIEAKSREMAAELALEKAESEMLQLKMEMQQRELLSSNLNVAQKNEMLQKLKKEVEALAANSNQQEQLGNIKSIFHNIQMVDANWESFKLYFEQVHPQFFDKLLLDFPNLTPNEIRLSAYLQLNLSNKEIAALQNIDPASVKRAKIRLKHKMNQI